MEGLQISTELQEISPKQPSRLEMNGKRVKALSMLRCKNVRYANDLNAFRNEFVIDDTETNDFLDKYRNQLVSCCACALGQVNPNDKHNYVALKTARFCNHRLCNVCNSLRAKKLRRKYFAFFNDEEMTVPVKRKQAHFFKNLDTTDRQVSENSFIDVLNDDEFDSDVVSVAIDEKTFNEILNGSKVKSKKKSKKKKESKIVFYVSGKEIAETFDFMHLTLTVPHKNGLWNGREYYAQQLLECFHTMRKCDWWSEMVYGGEACVETTQSEANNLHIHIHAMLMVDRNVKGSRNALMLRVLEKWNELTIDWTLDDTHFNEERRKGITNMLAFLKPKVWYMEADGKKIASENKYPNDEDPFLKLEADKVINKLDARGSTMVGLTSLYKEITALEYANSKGGTFKRENKFYRYVNTSKPKEIIKGVLECLKYHFEPCSLELDDETHTLNVPLLLQLIPNIYRKRLYCKFGGFYGLKQLNVTEEPISEDDIEGFLANAQAECYDPGTGEPIDSSELQFVVFDLKDLVFKKDEYRYSIHRRKIKMVHPPGETVRQAINSFMTVVTNKRQVNAMENMKEFIT